MTGGNLAEASLGGTDGAPEDPREGGKVQDWVADQTEELWKEAPVVRQRLEYLLKKVSLFEARISQLQEEVKALREAFRKGVPSAPVAKKMPVPKSGPPSKKA